MFELEIISEIKIKKRIAIQLTMSLLNSNRIFELR